MSEIVGLFGNVPAGVADPEIVAEAEWFLEQAKAGNVRAFAIVAVNGPNTSRRWFKAFPPYGDKLLGVIRRLEHDLLLAVEQEAERS